MLIAAYCSLVTALGGTPETNKAVTVTGVPFVDKGSVFPSGQSGQDLDSTGPDYSFGRKYRAELCQRRYLRECLQVLRVPPDNEYGF